MDGAISLPTHPNLKPHTPRVEVVKCLSERLSLLSGPNGRTRYSIEQEFGCVIESQLVEDDEAEV